MPYDFSYKVISAGDFDIVTWQKINDHGAPVHIYIEGDGHSFNAYGLPTDNPTPNGTVVRDLALADDSPNVIYMARPCQFIMSDSCTQTDWTDGRFSERVIDSMATAVRKVAGGRPVILIGYSGGAMISGLIIQNNPDIDVIKWITVAGVLNHSDWTEYFGDTPLMKSMDLNVLPDVAQVHYIAEKDEVVPAFLSNKWIVGKQKIIIPGALHGDLNGIELQFR